jgi:hypothetical protein
MFEAEMTRLLAQQHTFSSAALRPLLRIPTSDQVRKMPIMAAMFTMFGIDLMRPFHVARLRCRVLGFGGIISSLGGILPTSNHEVERIILAAKRKSSLSKRVAFLSRTQQVFQMWHVVHRPFSYSFAILAIVHIVIVTMLGYKFW